MGSYSTTNRRCGLACDGSRVHLGVIAAEIAQEVASRPAAVTRRLGTECSAEGMEIRQRRHSTARSKSNFRQHGSNPFGEIRLHLNVETLHGLEIPAAGSLVSSG